MFGYIGNKDMISFFYLPPDNEQSEYGLIPSQLQTTFTNEHAVGECLYFVCLSVVRQAISCLM